VALVTPNADFAETAALDARNVRRGGQNRVNQLRLAVYPEARHHTEIPWWPLVV
jgi:hypothetical protein